MESIIEIVFLIIVLFGPALAKFFGAGKEQNPRRKKRKSKRERSDEYSASAQKLEDWIANLTGQEPITKNQTPSAATVKKLSKQIKKVEEQRDTIPPVETLLPSDDKALHLSAYQKYNKNSSKPPVRISPSSHTSHYSNSHANLVPQDVTQNKQRRYKLKKLLTGKSCRDAILLAEIIGKPTSLR